jgi:hypothetical protein
MKAFVRCDHAIFLDSYAEGIAALGRKLDLPALYPLRYGASLNRRVSPAELLADKEVCAIIRKRAANEFEFWNLLLAWRKAPALKQAARETRREARRERSRERKERKERKRRRRIR